MTSIIKKISLISLSIALASSMAYAQGGYSSSQSQSQGSGYSSSQTQGGGYSSSASTGTSQTTTYTSTAVPPPAKEHKKHNKFSFSVTLPGQSEAIVVSDHGIRQPRTPSWVNARTGRPLPSHLVVSGGQSHPPATIFVCRANYRGGVHPGKLYDGRCNISWGGREIVTNHYEVLTSKRPLNWVPANNGAIPRHAVEGGFENHHPLYICQAEYRGGRHSGKVVGQNCDIGWGGQEIAIPYYNVLTY